MAFRHKLVPAPPDLCMFKVFFFLSRQAVALALRGRWVLALLCLLAAPWQSLAAPLLLQNLPEGQSLTGQVQVLIDPTGRLDLPAVQASQKFVQPPQVLRTPGDHQVLWLRVLVQQKEAQGDWLLLFPSTAMHALAFYGPFNPAGAALAEPVYTGLSLPYDTRPLGSERYAQRLRLPTPGVYTVYLRVQTNTAKTLNLRIWDTASYLAARPQKLLFDGLCYGVLLALVLYNLALVRGWHDRSTAYYVLTGVAAFLTLATYNGHTAHYLWPDSPWWIERSYVLAPALWVGFSALFGAAFLEEDAPARWPGLLAVKTGLLGCAAAILACGVVGWMEMAQNILEASAVAGVLLLTGLAFVRWRRGYQPAFWYLAGRLTLFASVLLTVAISRGWLNLPFWLANGMQIGVCAETVVFALALSARVRELQLQRAALRIHAEQMALVAATDPLTGLANRHGLEQAATDLLDRPGQQAVLMIDLDRFKPINDTLGHEVGDQVLVEVAVRLRSAVRESDVVARLGGDEFVVLLTQVLDLAQLEALARRLMQAVSRPMALGEAQVQVGASVGVALPPGDGRALKELMLAADRAMYQAKRLGCGYAFAVH